jgi:hypothetical protein
MMTLLFNALAILFFLSMLAFGISVCVITLRAHGQHMLAAFFGRESTPATSMAADVLFFGAQKNSVTTVNLRVNVPKIRDETPWALAA